jgi:Ca2+-transporting ATPase
MADGVVVSGGSIECNESSLTGESKTMKKSKTGDCFLLSSCLVTGGDEGRILVTGIGPHSQWGRIKVSLASESVNTPLQDKLETMSTQVDNLHSFTGSKSNPVAFRLVKSVWLQRLALS